MSQLRLASISLVLAALGLNAAHAQAPSSPATAAAPQAETVRPDLFKVIDPAVIKQLMADKKYAEVQDRIAQADAFPAKTPYEAYVVERMRLALGSSTGNNAMAMKALETVIGSGRLPASDQADFIEALGNFHYNAKDYPKAIEWFKRYQKESATPLKVRNALVRANYLNGDYATAKTGLLQVVAEADKAGTAPTLEDLRLLASSASKEKDTPTYVSAMERLVAFYPSDDYWSDLMNRLQTKPGFNNERLRLDVLRLQSVAQKAMEPDDIREMAELAQLAGYPTEAKNAMDAGFAAGVLGTGAKAAQHKQLRDKANKGAADDVKNIAAGEAAAEKNKDGLALVNLGYAYTTMGQADKGIALMEKGIAKGGMKRPEEAKLHLGVAYAKAGRKADAIKAFDTVKGADGMAGLAKYWTLWLNRPAAGTAPAAAAATAAAPAAAPVK